MTDIFITGTDTGVGKTVLAATLLNGLRAQGIDAVPMKPVQTGCETRDGTLIAPDLEFCLASIGLDPSPEERQLMCPFRYEPACSPHLAAAERGQRLEVDEITEKYNLLRRKHEAVIVEGAGGILVPLNESQTMLDLMVVLGLPVVLAARPGLGTLNHTLLSLRVLRSAGLEVIVVVLIDTAQQDWGPIEEDNAKTIREMGQVEIVAHLPCLADVTAQQDTATEALAPLIVLTGD